VSAALKKVDGVASVDVSSVTGTIDIALKPDNKATLPLLRRTIRSTGNETKDAAITARGRIVGAGDTFALDLLNGSSLPLAKAAAGAFDALVEVTGVSRADDKNVELLTISSIKQLQPSDARVTRQRP
jgi:copper chaperone CopZ